MKGDIDNIIAEILNGTATDIEQNIFNDWLNDDEINREFFDNLKKYWQIENRGLKIINEDDVRKKIWVKAHESKHTISRNFLPLIYRVAAVIAFILTFTFLIRDFLIVPNKNVDIVELKTIEKKNKAGVKSQIHLSDGSIINLNAESSIKFTEGFRDSIRWVELKGEAFFNVAKNVKKPFVVKSGDVITRALGTAFNINANAENSTVNVSLVEGRVEVHSILEGEPTNRILLEPSQYVSFQKGNVIGNGLFDFEKVIGWKDGIIVFENADYNHVIKKLEKWYGVTFKLDGSEPDWNLDANFDNASLEQVLEVLSHSERFEYQFEGDTVKLKMI